MQNSNIITISTNHPCYPDAFRHVKPAITEFYALGDTNLLVQPHISIVGTRTITPYGIDVTTQMARAAVSGGLTVVSGLAFGVDSVAHTAALNARGHTIAVVPASLHAIYPARHYNLAKRIVDEGGLLISEHKDAIRPMKHYFVLRNRLIAALADQILVTEAGQKSGARHTVEFGHQLGKHVAMVPGNITSPMSQYPNEEIRTGITPVTSPDDLLALLRFNNIPINEQSIKTPQGNYNEYERAIIDALSHQNLSSDALMEVSKLTVAQFNVHITMLEINGLIERSASNAWRLAK